MFIERLVVQRFRQLRNAEFGPFSEPAQQSELVVVAGPNGSGKSSVLELLSYGLASRYSWNYYSARSLAEHSFSMRIGLSAAQIRALEPVAEPAVVDYARNTRGYWFEVNMPTQMTDAERQLNNRLHHWISEQFSSFTSTLGFFLRADRGYASKNYDRQQLWNWRRRVQPSHWNSLAYLDSVGQYNDMYDFLIEQGFHYTHELGEFTKKSERGQPASKPSDPLVPYNNLLGQLFPGYAFVDATLEDLRLQVRLPTGDVIPFQDMSSGEKEVFFILSFFLRRNISDSIIVIDEPELHLHPELARKLIQLMRAIKPNNQIWCATHSAELVDEAGRERTYFFRQDTARTQTQCSRGTDEGAEALHLRDMFGYSGFVGVSKKVVFLEGANTSADRKTFSALFGGAAREVKLIPAGSWGNLYRINAAILALLQSDFAQCSYFLIRDRDYLSAEAVQKYVDAGEGRLFVLQRYHIENYLLEWQVMSHALSRVYQRSMSPENVMADLRDIARRNSAAFLRDLAVSRLSELFQSEDFSIGNHSSGQALVAEGNQVVQETAANLTDALLQNAGRVISAVAQRTTPDAVTRVIDGCVDQVRAAFESNAWRDLFPGRYLLEKFSTKHGLGNWPTLQNVLIDEFAQRPAMLAAELRAIAERIGKG